MSTNINYLSPSNNIYQNLELMRIRVNTTAKFEEIERDRNYYSSLGSGAAIFAIGCCALAAFEWYQSGGDIDVGYLILGLCAASVYTYTSNRIKWLKEKMDTECHIIRRIYAAIKVFLQTADSKSEECSGCKRVELIESLKSYSFHPEVIRGDPTKVLQLDSINHIHV